LEGCNVHPRLFGRCRKAAGIAARIRTETWKRGRIGRELSALNAQVARPFASAGIPVSRTAGILACSSTALPHASLPAPQPHCRTHLRLPTDCGSPTRGPTTITRELVSAGGATRTRRARVSSRRHRQERTLRNELIREYHFNSDRTAYVKTGALVDRICRWSRRPARRIGQSPRREPGDTLGRRTVSLRRHPPLCLVTSARGPNGVQPLMAARQLAPLTPPSQSPFAGHSPRPDPIRTSRASMAC